MIPLRNSSQAVFRHSNPDPNAKALTAAPNATRPDSYFSSDKEQHRAKVQSRPTRDESWAAVAQERGGPGARTAWGPGAVVVVFVLFMLIKREDLRDRIIHLIGQRQFERDDPGARRGCGHKVSGLPDDAGHHQRDVLAFSIGHRAVLHRRAQRFPLGPAGDVATVRAIHWRVDRAWHFRWRSRLRSPIAWRMPIRNVGTICRASS